MEVKKLFALASVTALAGFVTTGLTAACSSTEVVTVQNDASATSGSSSGTSGTTKRDSGKSTQGDDDDTQGDDDDVIGDDDDDDDTTQEPTCLNKDPIDATKYPYTSVAPGQKAACTPKELTDFSAYYKAHAADDDLIDTWPTAVSEKCAACVFTDATGQTPPDAWGPMVIGVDAEGGKVFQVNRGGCVEAVSKKPACGRAYQNFQDCTLEACLKDCKTQAEFTKCRQDATVLQTSCKQAFADLKTACDEKLIGQYETACKGTTYTFEGPIKQLCITGAGAKDGGVDAKSP